MRRPVVVRILLGVGMLALVLVVAYGARHLVLSPTAVAAAPTPSSDTPAAQVARPNTEPLETAIRRRGTITVAGIGSSVGNGAELPDAAAQSPVGRLGQLLRSRYPDATVDVHNLSVDGSTAFDGQTVYTTRVRPLHPTVLLIAFGMNDGQTAQFNSGVTLPGSVAALRSIVASARADGTTVLVATTPSPDTDGNDFGLPKGLPVNYPTPGGALVPSAEDAVTTIDGEPFSTRHATWNAEARKLVQEQRVTLIDAAEDWLEGVRRYGQDSLFNVAHGAADPGRFVHPNLRGHEVSYWAAESAFVRGLPAAPAG